MSDAAAVRPGDQAKVSVLVAVPREEAFRIFTEEIDAWWRHGRKFRVAGPRRGIIHLEPRLGGRLFESFEGARGPKVVQTGEVLAWEPPSRLLLLWRIVNFAPDERTEVEVTFEATPSGKTQVTVIHRGWSDIRPDHPARHGKASAAFLRELGLWWGDLFASLRLHAKARRDEPESS